MTNPGEPGSEKPPETQVPPPVVVEVECQAAGNEGRIGVPGILRRWRRDDMLRKASFALRAAALFFSLLSLVIGASNQHGGWMNFDHYEEYRYLLAMSIFSTLYAGLQSLKQVHQLSTGNEFFQQRTSSLIDFLGDQIMAYLLVSSASSAIPMTDRMREGSDNLFTDSSAAAIGMSFLAFLAYVVSAAIAGYKLSIHSFI